MAQFGELESTPVYKRNRLLAAAVDVRKGECLVRIGRSGEGSAAIERGLPNLKAQGDAFAGDVRTALMALGAAAADRFDYDRAAFHYRAAADMAKGTARIVPLLRLSQVTMFDRDGSALAAADEARKLSVASPDLGKKDVAAVQSQYARVLLNEGRAAEAYRILKDSLAKQGGLTNKVGLSDITTRSDLAIAALQNKRADDARLYLAYTGAGRMKDTPFNRAAIMAAPACGEGGVTPDDMAIVEFSLESDGRVVGVTPIYATGGRRAAVAFAGAVSEWSWRAEEAAKIPALFRYTTRVELRCSKAAEGKGILAPLREAAMTWLAATAGTAPWADLSDAAALPLQRAALERARATGNQAGIAQVALAMANSSVTTSDETATLLDTAAAAARAASAPASVRHLIELRQAGSNQRDVSRWRATLRTLLASSDYASDPLSADTVRLLISQPAGKTPPPDDAASLQSAVASDAALPANHPLKVAALLGQANVLAAKGDVAGARSAFDRTGLSGEQCAQLGLAPVMRSLSASSSDYPMAAVRMGFEGWVIAEADVTPDGRTTVQRATIAYPPFVFDDAAIGIAKEARYSSSFRPDGTLACQGVRLPVKFLLPN
ncbi:energy transducer TonB [Sphingomonas bacterium]|uniref:energy transducer TonB n=1 Tax=Sphingomonas bacterium TaxID=1895847 RepID=UPI0015777418|nr:energy transducer TonB [Sphingomonas bacterium]